MNQPKIRKLVVVVEETHGEAGRTIAPPTRKAAAIAVIENPFAGRNVADLEPLIAIGEALGGLLAGRAVAALGVAPAAIESYGKAAIVGEAGELEHAAAILHPRIRARMRDELAALPAGTPYAVLVIPLLFETGQQDSVDRVLVVEASDATRIARVTGRDDVTADQVQRILGAQCSTADRAARADDLIRNEGSESDLAAKVAALHGKYLALARRG